MNRLLPQLLGLVTSAVAAASLAAVPPSTSFQGYLTDPAGSPLHGMTEATFSVYNVEIGGVPLWADSMLIDVSQGLFSVQLGNDLNPLPATLFDGPAYIGVDIASDGEMMPRRLLTTAPYAFRALDADTLDGVSATGYLNITGGQLLEGSIDVSGSINAFGGIDLQGEGDVSDVRELVFSPTGDGIRFADGSSQLTNAVNSVLAADGDGSLLDADLLDGQHANEIIAAASDEVRTAITNADLPLAIVTSGSYYFAETLTYADPASSAITIAADDVSIDMMGFSLTGPGSTSGDASHGFFWTTQSGITIADGSISSFGGVAILNTIDTSSRNRVVRVQTTDNGIAGIVINGSALVSDCVASFNDDVGIVVGSGSHVLNNTVDSNHRGVLAIGDATRIIGNIVSNNQLTGISAGDASKLEDNVINGNNILDDPAGGALLINRDNQVVGNTFNANRVYGIFALGEGNLIDDNHITDTVGTGIRFGNSGSAYRNNTVVNATLPFDGPGVPVDLGGNVSF